MPTPSVRSLVALGFTLGVGLPALGQDKAPTLRIGDPAPEIQVKEFLKGEPVRAFEKGKVYVVEFWATWCGPCRATIPHLTELQKAHPDVTVLGVSIWEEEPKEIRPFVREMGDKMDYRVAADAVPDGAKPNDGAMASRWMDAAGEEGIPTAFLINKEGKVAWVGHPLELDKPLADVLAGTYDLKAAGKARLDAQKRARAIEAVEAKLAQAEEAGDTKGVLAVLDEAIAADGTLEPIFGPAKFSAMRELGGDARKVLAYGKRLIDDVLKDDADGLNEFAWSIVDPDAEKKPTAPLIDLALAAARRADKLEDGENPYIADTLAKALFDSGDAIQALAAQERALRLAEGTPLEEDEGMIDRLKRYRRAAVKFEK